MHCFISYMACLNAYRTESQSYSVLKIRVPGAHAHVRSIGLQRSLQEKSIFLMGTYWIILAQNAVFCRLYKLGHPWPKKTTFSCKVHLVKCWVCEGSNYTNYSWDFMGVVKCCKSSKTASIPICLLSLWSPTSIFATKVTPNDLVQIWERHHEFRAWNMESLEGSRTIRYIFGYLIILIASCTVM